MTRKKDADNATIKDTGNAKYKDADHAYILGRRKPFPETSHKTTTRRDR